MDLSCCTALGDVFNGSLCRGNEIVDLEIVSAQNEASSVSKVDITTTKTSNNKNKGIHYETVSNKIY